MSNYKTVYFPCFGQLTTEQVPSSKKKLKYVNIPFTGKQCFELYVWLTLISCYIFLEHARACQGQSDSIAIVYIIYNDLNMTYVPI